MFKRSITQPNHFPTTRSSVSARLKRILIEASVTSLYGGSTTVKEARIVCEAFLTEFADTQSSPKAPKETATQSEGNGPTIWTKTSLRALSAAQVDEVAIPLGISTDDTKEETISAILALQSADLL